VVPNAIGNLHLSWEVDMGGMPIGCSNAETAYFDLGGGQAWVLACAANSADLMSIRTGFYNVQTSLRSGMFIEAVGPTLGINVAPYTLTDGGHIVFNR